MRRNPHSDEKQIDPQIEEEYQAYQPELPLGKKENDEGFVVCNGPEYEPLGDRMSSGVKQPGEQPGTLKEPYEKLALFTRLLLSGKK